jgi:hypothetical protein
VWWRAGKTPAATLMLHLIFFCAIVNALIFLATPSCPINHIP